MEKKHVLILGGGIGGLSTAHVLMHSAPDKYKITIVESNSQIGGMARSAWRPSKAQDAKDTDIVPTEYCWRIYGPAYHHIRRMMKEIPSVVQEDTKEDKKCVHDHLVNLHNMMLLQDKGGAFFMNYSVGSLSNFKSAFGHISFKSKFKGLDLYVRGLASCEGRRTGDLEAVSWKDMVEEIGDPEIKKYMCDSTAPIFGTDLYRCSASSILRDLEWFNIEDGPPPSVMDGPTSDVLFASWKAHLEAKGVTFLLQHKVEALEANKEETRVTGVHVKTGAAHVWPPLPFSGTEDIRHNQEEDEDEDEEDDEEEEKEKDKQINADYIVSCVSVSQAARLHQQLASKLTTESKKHTEYKAMAKGLDHLVENAQHKMVGVQVFFNQRLLFKGDEKATRTGYYLPDSPWQLVIEPQGVLWGQGDRNMQAGSSTAKDVWSIGLCDQRSHGRIHDKPWTECTEKEIMEDMWEQVINCKGVFNHFKTAETGESMDWDKHVSEAHLWHTYRYDQGQAALCTPEPKFSSNAGTLKARPPTQSPGFDNLLFANAYTQTIDSEMFLMDGAAEAGQRAANAILKKSGLGHLERPVVVEPRKLNTVMGPVRAWDWLHVQLGYPHPSVYVGSSTAAVFLSWFVPLFLAVAWFINRFF